MTTAEFLESCNFPQEIKTRITQLLGWHKIIVVLSHGTGLNQRWSYHSMDNPNDPNGMQVIEPYCTDFESLKKKVAMAAFHCKNLETVLVYVGQETSWYRVIPTGLYYGVLRTNEEVFASMPTYIP